MALPYRADHVGSLLRPPELQEARRPDLAGDELRRIEDCHILDVLERQRAIGLKIFTDGEVRRTGFMEGNLLSEDDQWRKLQLVVDTARRLWKDA